MINEGYIYSIDDNKTTFERNQYEENLYWILASQPLLVFIYDYEVHPRLGLSSGHKPVIFNLPIGADDKPVSPGYHTTPRQRTEAGLELSLTIS